MRPQIKQLKWQAISIVMNKKLSTINVLLQHFLVRQLFLFAYLIALFPRT